MTKTKKARLIHLSNALTNLGFSSSEIDQLLSVERGLHRWHELECGTGNDRVSVSVERDEKTEKPFKRVQFQTRSGWIDRKTPCRDMEKANLSRLSRIMEGKTCKAYVQGDPRGCALYILRPGDVPEGCDSHAYYSRGLAICID
jgi:hypothetical protein